MVRNRVRPYLLGIWEVTCSYHHYATGEPRSRRPISQLLGRTEIQNIQRFRSRVPPPFPTPSQSILITQYISTFPIITRTGQDHTSQINFRAQKFCFGQYESIIVATAVIYAHNDQRIELTVLSFPCRV
jgi:hypothetical protein